MIARVIPLRRMPLRLAWLDYGISNELKTKAKPGQLVKIPLQNHVEFGMIHSLLDQAPTRKIKDIIEMVAERPFLNSAQLSFLEMAAMYATPLGFLVKMSLPPLQKRKLSKIQDTYSSPNDNTLLKKSNKPKLQVYKNTKEKSLFLNDTISSGQTLILVPELNDVNGILALISENKQSSILTVTSELTEKELFEKWIQLWRGEKTIILGTRRALFLPFTNLQTIIMDDEANPNYKSWDMAPRFHTRDAALLLSQHHQAPLHFLTHTPSVETYYFAEKNIYSHNLTSNTNNKILHLPEITNMADERRGRNYGILSDDLENA
jgi:primosomal protein N'